MEKVYGIDVSDNAFISSADKGAVNIGVIAENTDENALTAKNNTFIGNFTELFKR